MAKEQKLFSFPAASMLVGAAIVRISADTDKNTDHSYAPVYDVLLAPYLGTKGKQCVIAEVGVYRGGSVALWQYLCPNAFVIGIDAADYVTAAMKAKIDTKRYANIRKDAYCAQTFLRIQELAPAGLDLAIDDGPHTELHQAMFLKMYLPLLKPGGVAVIEDVQSTTKLQTLIDEIPDTWAYQIEDREKLKSRQDDRLLIVQRPV